MENEGATVVISHQIKQGKQDEYEAWLQEIGVLCRSSPGNIDWQIIRPIAGLTFVYTVIVRFDTISHLKNWMDSDTRQALIEKARPMFEKDDNYQIQSGLDFLFPTDRAKTPVRWKQYLVTWSAIYPLSLLIPFILHPI